MDTAHPSDHYTGATSILLNNNSSRDSPWGGGGESGNFSSASGNTNTTSHLNNTSRTARSSVSEMDSLSEADENNKLLEINSATIGGDNLLEDDEDGQGESGEEGEGRRRESSGDPDKSCESTRLLSSSSNTVEISNSVGIVGSPPLPSSDAIHRQLAADILNKRDSHGFHGKRKFNFRSDSVFSDVMPMSSNAAAGEVPKTPEAREKSGSLSSLKGQKDSKWASLRKKLGRLNSSSEKNQVKALEQQAHQFQQQQAHHTKSGKSGLAEKRSLLQRAKTLSILPVKNIGSKEDIVKKPKEQSKPPELFNVGGEMNMIPLELLIDINDLKM